MPLVSGNMARLISIMITPMSLNLDAGFEQAGSALEQNEDPKGPFLSASGKGRPFPCAA